MRTWENIPERIRHEIKSATHTVIAAAILELSIQMQIHGVFLFTKETVAIAAGAAILRAVQKAIVRFIRNSFPPETK